MNLYVVVTTCFYNCRVYREHELVMFREDRELPRHFRICRRKRGQQNLSERQELELDGQQIRDTATLSRALTHFEIPDQTRTIIARQLEAASHRVPDILDDRERFHRIRYRMSEIQDIENWKRHRPGWQIERPDLVRDIQ